MSNDVEMCCSMVCARKLLANQYHYCRQCRVHGRGTQQEPWVGPHYRESPGYDAKELRLYLSNEEMCLSGEELGRRVIGILEILHSGGSKKNVIDKEL